MAEKIVFPSNPNSNGGSIPIENISYDVTGMNLPVSVTGGKTIITATQLSNGLQALASSNPGQWAQIQYALFQANFYGGSQPGRIGAWDATDKTAVTRFMQGLTLNNIDTTKAVKVLDNLTQEQNMGIKYGGAARTAVTKVSVPNAMDLGSIADTAFRKALGRPPTDKEANAFVKSYQGEVMAAARATASQAAAINAPQAIPTTTTDVGTQVPSNGNAQTPPPPQNTIAQNYANINKSGGVAMVQNQQAPDAGVAAAEFARKASPVEAGNQGLNTALGDWFKSLGGSGL